MEMQRGLMHSCGAWGSNQEVAGQGNFVASDKVPISVDNSLMPPDRICHGSEDPRL